MTHRTFLDYSYFTLKQKTRTQFIMMKLSSRLTVMVLGVSVDLSRCLPTILARAISLSQVLPLDVDTITIAHSETFGCRRFKRIYENKRLILFSHTTKSVNKPNMWKRGHDIKWKASCRRLCTRSTRHQYAQTQLIRDRDYRLRHHYYCCHVPNIYSWSFSLIHVFIERNLICSVLSISRQAARQGIVRFPAPS